MLLINDHEMQYWVLAHKSQHMSALAKDEAANDCTPK